ncbi:HAMP domain-containing histidine kinase [bacterium]|nr:HAMP domain-containing histidine kinase [bacterium]
MDRNNSIKEMSSYIATLIHDLKTPVSAQIMAVDLLLKGSFGSMNSEQREVLEQIKKSCEYSQNLVHSILDTYLCENGQLKPKPEIFDWQKLVGLAIDETCTLAKDKSQKIVAKNYTNNTEIFADKFQLKRVIVNLISNAIKYGFDNSIIEIETKKDKGRLIFNVKNNSKYINNYDTNRLFDKFRRDKRGKSGISCGLGLYLVKQIITAHKGKVFGKCEKSGECNFGFSIPIKNNF